ncbi:membrane protein [Flavobacterium rivuli WB 3.3-2 = DSM 21788]|uniref:Membrane protein n=1 Tax=Flavobacterium rivuli WB 3.3-2 = DSM 21788 TaxID=1121895 RepID=A0A0A2M928_9FLAO|nr:inner membrane protein YiaA [Flavobacterium rivuli]KGO84800.1 membrane protein [Flavobacterium rivuli WB 3.3-2 = DSM 21788]
MEPLKSFEVNETSPSKKETTTTTTTTTPEGPRSLKPTNAFVGASWMALLTGAVAYCIGLFNATMQLNEKGYYFTILLFGLFSVISVQKSVRDRLEGIPVTDIYYGISWFTTVASIVLLVIGLWNADLLLSEKGFFGMSFALSLFAAIAVQKNTRDLKSA